MTASDLPTELWLEILSYLPQHVLRKLFGINRLLFQLAMNLIYEEVCFISADKRMLDTFEGMMYAAVNYFLDMKVTDAATARCRCLNVTKSVQRLYIRPDFLPGMVESVACQGRFNRLLNSWSESSPKQGLHPGNESIQDCTVDEVLDHAKKALMACAPTLEELTLALHDLEITKSFESFLQSLWTSFKVSSLRKLSIEVTVEKIPLVLYPFPKSTEICQNLEWLDITIAFSRFSPTKAYCSKAERRLVKFISAFRSTLAALTLSFPPFLDFTSLFNSLGHFPKLKNLEIFMSVNRFSLSDPTSLTKFLKDHKGQLQHFSIRAYPRSNGFYLSDSTFDKWTNQILIRTEFPKLKTLVLDLRSKNSYNISTPIPDVQIIMRNITSLVLTDSVLHTEQLEELLDVLSKRAESIRLEKFHFHAMRFSPQDLALLSSKLPGLEILEIVCHGPYYGYVHGSDFFSWNLHDYSKWQLRYLRISRVSVCGIPHPWPKIAFALAESIPSINTVNIQWYCACSI